MSEATTAGQYTIRNADGEIERVTLYDGLNRVTAKRARWEPPLAEQAGRTPPAAPEAGDVPAPGGDEVTGDGWGEVLQPIEEAVVEAVTEAPAAVAKPRRRR